MLAGSLSFAQFLYEQFEPRQSAASAPRTDYCRQLLCLLRYGSDRIELLATRVPLDSTKKHNLCSVTEICVDRVQARTQLATMTPVGGLRLSEGSEARLPGYASANDASCESGRRIVYASSPLAVLVLILINMRLSFQPGTVLLWS